jgi:hypothetical protein
MTRSGVIQSSERRITAADGLEARLEGTALLVADARHAKVYRFAVKGGTACRTRVSAWAVGRSTHLCGLSPSLPLWLSVCE